MEKQKKIMAAAGGGDRLSDLPEPILHHILSKLWDEKQVVRTSILSTRWRFLWMSVPLSLCFTFPDSENQNFTLAYLACINGELYYWKSCEKIKRFRVWRLRYDEIYAKDVDLWIHFAMKVANVEVFTLSIISVNQQKYEFPQFGYKNSSLRELDLQHCQLNPCGSSVNWSNLVSLSIGYVELTDDAMEKVLSGCPNLERLELQKVSGIHRLETKSVKLRELTLEEYYDKNQDIWLEIIAPHIKHLEILGLSSEIRIEQGNVASLVYAIIRLNFDFEDEESNLEKEFRCLKELLQSVAHVENLELGSWCIECLSILELKGWQSPPSSRKLLELNVAGDQLDFPGICSFLQSSLDLETLVIDWFEDAPRDFLSSYTNEDKQTRRFETHNFNGSFPHLKTIKIDNLWGLLSENKFVLPLVKYLLKHAIVLEKFVIGTSFVGSDLFPDHAKMTQEFLSFPRSSPHISVVFSY
ncbi:LOW QUALITY PROTEIN: F-box protein At5g03100-like [Solanum dulcamara]|uniref:LOW QUALITY PROTEIN: F-box protein At5g03100-like n=1 Tax=Solanum dulcamara TaxID=45834 RepID=UPI0024862AE6|nr:LOW QUALITY PROTEIN: F-box protein At5g03100-like [Solanum dulcamara]